MLYRPLELKAILVKIKCFKISIILLLIRDFITVIYNHICNIVYYVPTYLLMILINIGKIGR